MTRNLKALGLGLVAIFALGASVASSASATDFFTAGVADTTLTVTGGPQVFHIPGTSASFECFHLKGKGTTKEVKQSAVTLKELLYTGKKENTENPECDSAFGAITFDMNGCDYELTGTTDKEHPKGSGKFDAKIWIVCPENNVKAG